MILYTTMPAELIFPSDASPETSIVNCAGRSVLARREGAGWRVERLLSTDPTDFLDPRWQPGSVVPSESTT